MKSKWFLFIVSVIVVIAMMLVGCGSSGSSEESAASAEDTIAADVEEAASDEHSTGIAGAVPGLDAFMGGWGYQSAPTECSIASFFEEDGQLKVNFAAIPGGGYFVLFDPIDISFDNDVMTCVNGQLTTDGGTASDAMLVATPVDSEPGAYFFRVTSEEFNMYSDQSRSYHYQKVAQTEEELKAWIDENTPEL